MKEQKFNIPFIALIAASFLLIVSFFLPFASADGKYKDYLKDNPKGMFAEEIDMTNKEAVNISLIEYAKMYGYVATSMKGHYQQQGMLSLVLIIAMGVFSILTLIFAIMKKAGKTIVFDCLNFLFFFLYTFDLKDRGVLPSDDYNYGIAYYLYIIFSIIIIISLIWYIINTKKQKNSSQSVNSYEENA
ncbi:MAG: hypothetical protein ACLSGN_02610 [Oscillospiraceae bacterium]